LHTKYAEGQEKERWGHKTPRFIRDLDLLHTHFPEARFIHIVRDPRAVVSSLVRSDVHRSTVYHATYRWFEDVRSGLEFENRHPELILRISYEALVQQTSKILDDIIEYLSLEVRIGKGIETAGSEEYSKFYENIHQNLDREIQISSLSRWKDELSDSDIAFIESVCSTQMSKLGYEPESTQLLISRYYIALQWFLRFLKLFQQTIRYLRYRPRYLLYIFFRKWRLGLLPEFLGNIHR
jgi:hypothetical protein